MPIAESRTRYQERPQGSVSKLRTIADGLRILRMITLLPKEQHPVYFLGFLALCSCYQPSSRGSPWSASLFTRVWFPVSQPLIWRQGSCSSAYSPSLSA
jgi:hypothetical protein